MSATSALPDADERAGYSGFVSQRLAQRQAPLEALQRLRVVALKTIEQPEVAENARDSGFVPDFLPQRQALLE